MNHVHTQNVKLLFDQTVATGNASCSICTRYIDGSDNDAWPIYSFLMKEILNMLYLYLVV